MTALPEHLRLAAEPIAPQTSVVSGAHYRFTVLTERLVRCEYSPTGVFEDRPTQTVLHRDLPTPEFRVHRDGQRVQIITSALHLDYAGGEFSPQSINVKELTGGYHSVWRPGEEPDSKFAQYVGVRTQLGGTARTLDTVDGATELENGLANSLGITSLDDSASLALTDDGWVAQRPEGNVDVYVFAHGHDYGDAVRDFYRISGPQPILPRYALGNWWSRYHAYTQAEYQELVERFEAEGLPFSVAVVDMDWHLTEIDPKYGAGWTGYTWNRELFPDHVGFLAWLHERGLKVSLNVHPAEGIRAFEEAYPRVAEALGIDPSTELPATFDFADPAFIKAYFEQVHHPMEAEGVDFWWLDWQQGSHSRIPGLDPLWMLNHLHFLDSARDGQRPLTFSRYAGPGSHRYPVGFSGDTVISWASLAFQPYFTATASNIGYGWWSHDIGGHMFGIKDDELATRWVQFGVFSPINRLHSSNGIFNGKEPWRFNPVARQVMGDFLRLRHRLLPWLFTENVAGHDELRPLMRPLYWTDPDEQVAYAAQNQYWFGRDLLVAPITTPIDPTTQRASERLWLPCLGGDGGRWTDLFTNLTYRGGRAVTMYRPISQIPVLARAGAIIPMTPPDEFGMGNPTRLELHVVAGADGEYVLYEDDDRATPRAVRTRITYSQQTGEVTVHPAEGELAVVPATRTITLHLHGVGEVRVLDLGEVSTSAGASGRFDGPREPDNQLDERIFTFLDEAQMPIFTKERALQLVKDHPTPGARVAALSELEGLDAQVLAVLRELILALE
ncbi:TIM-barrel domain-containing protein [Luteococcus sp. H138]|uniref:glycoside hydrolase family 31 protein n=1 Tax=unclassified Luteococcus TaxID=2639923 RepID=UPI00313D5D76